MPATPNLVGKRYGRLRVLRLLHRDARGNRLWECRCKCKRLTVVTTGSLQFGHTRSCGCLKQRRFGRPFTKAKSRKAYASRERVFEDGRWWRSLLSAHRYLGVTRSTFKLWVKSCPWLGGKGIEKRKMKGAHGRTYNHYAEDGDLGL
ncbi:MAG TPA: hypothetical protein VFW33_02880, partial [Gemmataceae bacterium]|nr:hypothetical protein [Gemmataceae bacterium]